MHPKLKQMLTNWRIVVLLIFLLLAVVAINPSFNSDGVSITSVKLNSSANLAGISSPNPDSQPRQKEVIKSILGKSIGDVSDYYVALSELSSMQPGDEVSVITNKNSYSLILKPKVQIETTNETETYLQNVTVEVYDEASETVVNKTIPKQFTRNKTKEYVIGIEDLGLQVKNAPSTNLRKGLDLEGGIRVILEPEGNITGDEFELLILNMKQRLNVYGLADIKVAETVDLEGKKFILVELPGASQEDVKSLILSQGKFEAKIGNDTIFAGGRDIKSVLRTADRSGIDPRRGCSLMSDGSTWGCRFYFGIVLSQESADRQAKFTQQVDVITVDEQGRMLARDDQYLAQKLDFYLDNQLTESLNIGADLKGKAVTDIQISGSGSGRNQQEAKANALKEMKRLQTILVTGSLPTTLKVIKTDTISPSLGKEFLNNAILIGIIAVLVVISIIYVAYRRFVVILPIMFTQVSELVLMLGFAAAVHWNLDLAAIAAIILVIGTGVDHLIIITDETLNPDVQQLTWLQKLKRAFVIILAAGSTSASAMIPLLFAGAGLLKGFALTTIVGVCIGVLIARPAYSAIIEILLKE